MLHQFQQVGRLPVWELWGNETDCMIGYHAISVITDAWAKGIRQFDKMLAYHAMVAALRSGWRGLEIYRKNGYLTIEDESESVSKTLEYSYNFGCFEMFCKSAFPCQDMIPADLKYGKDGWKNLLAQTPRGKFFAPRYNGGIIQPFDPYEVNNHYTEANAWQYRFAPVHDLGNYIALLGGPDSLEAALDQLFQASTKTTGRTQDDISGLIGQYAHGNEPSHHLAWLYLYTGSPYKAARYNHQVLNQFYRNAQDGLIGNEDCGQMSAWYVWTALGMYPICPGTDSIALSYPLFEKIKLYQKERLCFDMRTNQLYQTDAKQIGIRTLYSNSLLTRPIIPYSLFYPNNLYVLEMNQTEQSGYLHVSATFDATAPLPAPLVSYDIRNEKVYFKVSSIFKERFNYIYELNGKVIRSQKNELITPFSGDIFLNVKIEQPKTHFESRVANVFVHKKPTDRIIKMKSIPNRQYTGGGEDALVDGLLGDTDWRKGRWQGYQGQDLELVVTLKDVVTISTSGLRCLQDQRSWILMPSKLEVWYSTDSVNFDKIGAVSPLTDDHSDTIVIESLMVKHPARQVKYIKIIAQNYGNLPAWHPGSGEPSFIFADEVLWK